MKKTLLAVVLGSVIGQANANYPVFDMTNYMAAMKEIQHMQQDYDQAVQRYNTLRAQYDALKSVQESLKHGVSIGSLYDVSTMYSSYLGKITTYSEDYFKDVTTISTKGKKFATQLMSYAGHEEDLSDVPTSMRKATQNAYYLEGEEMACVEMQKEMMKAYKQTLDDSAYRLSTSPDMKTSQDILNKMEYDKKAYEFNKELLSDYMKMLKDQRELNQKQVQLAQRNFFASRPEKKD